MVNEGCRDRYRTREIKFRSGRSSRINGINSLNSIFRSWVEFWFFHISIWDYFRKRLQLGQIVRLSKGSPENCYQPRMFWHKEWKNMWFVSHFLFAACHNNRSFINLCYPLNSVLKMKLVFGYHLCCKFMTYNAVAVTCCLPVYAVVTLWCNLIIMNMQ